jgi:hypothetical protein
MLRDVNLTQYLEGVLLAVTDYESKIQLWKFWIKLLSENNRHLIDVQVVFQN